MTIVWTDDELKFIRENYPPKGCAYIAKELGYSPTTIQKQAHRMKVYRDKGLIDMTGQKYGLWTVIGRGSPQGKNSRWLCRCECGVEHEVQRQSLIHGTSAGCSKCRVYIKLDGMIPATYIRSIKNRCKYNNLDFDLDAEYLNNLLIKQNMRCALSGVPIWFGKTTIDKDTASLDKINPRGGYTKDNVQWVHLDVNYMKNWLSQERFLYLCKLIVAYRPLSLEEAIRFAQGD